MGTANAAWNPIRYPIPGKFDDEGEVPFLMNFVAVMYTNKIYGRAALGAGAGGSEADITLPLPKQIKVNNRVTYSRGETETGGILDPTAAGIMSGIADLGLGIVNIATAGLSGLIEGELSGAMGYRPMDQRESIFDGAEFRTHSYTWDLIPKTKGAGEIIKQIGKAFQTLMYPKMSTLSQGARVVHPPIWNINVVNVSKGSTGTFEWDLGPLPCVLTSADVHTQGAGGGAYGADGGFPAVTTLQLDFVELEPAINSGERLASRSQVKGGAAGYALGGQGDSV